MVTRKLHGDEAQHAAEEALAHLQETPARYTLLHTRFATSVTHLTRVMRAVPSETHPGLMEVHDARPPLVTRAFVRVSAVLADARHGGELQTHACTLAMYATSPRSTLLAHTVHPWRDWDVLEPVARALGGPLGAAPWRTPAHAHGAGPPPHVSVLSCNVWNWNRAWHLRRGAIARMIRAHRPAVVAVQEARNDAHRRDAGMHQAHQLYELVGREYQFVHAPAMFYAHDRAEEGVSVFSRLPVLAVAVLPLSRRTPPEHGDDHQRVVLHVRVLTARGPASVYVTHMSLSDSARTRGAHEILSYVHRREHSSPLHGRAAPLREPAVLMGDLNECPDGPALAVLTRGGFRDEWAAVHPHERGWTFRAHDPLKRIDFVLTRGALRVVAPGNMAVLAPPRPLVRRRTRLHLSDHMPVLARLVHTTHQRAHTAHDVCAWHGRRSRPRWRAFADAVLLTSKPRE